MTRGINKTNRARLWRRKKTMNAYQSATTLHDDRGELIAIAMDRANEREIVPVQWPRSVTQINHMSPSCVQVKYSDGTYELQWLP